jgi:hypothetical protein
MLRTVLLSLLLTVGPALASPNVGVTLLPPNLTGQPGETVGWSFSIEMLFPNLWALVNSIDFQWDTPIGTLNPFYTPPDLVIGPGALPNENPYVFIHIPEVWGILNSYTIGEGAQPGDTVGGYLQFNFTVFNEDPNGAGFDPGIHEVGPETVEVETSITVPLSGEAIPEASTNLTIAAGLLALGVFQSRRKSVSSGS